MGHRAEALGEVGIVAARGAGSRDEPQLFIGVAPRLQPMRGGADHPCAIARPRVRLSADATAVLANDVPFEPVMGSPARRDRNEQSGVRP
jgi:hypothetical protein